MTVGFSESFVGDICTAGDLTYQRGCECRPQRFPKVAIAGGIGVFPGQSRCIGGNGMGYIDETVFNPVKKRAEELAVREAVSDLQDSILENDQEKIIENWNILKDTFKNTAEYRMLAAGSKNGEVDERLVNALIADNFEKWTDGQNLKKLIKDNCSSNWWTGFKNLFFTGSKSADQLIEEMFKVKQPCGCGAARVCGAVIPATTICAAVGAGVAAGSIGGPVGAAIGAGVGLLWAVIAKICN